MAAVGGGLLSLVLICAVHRGSRVLGLCCDAVSSALLVTVALARHSRQGDESHSEEEMRKNKEEEEAIV